MKNLRKHRIAAILVTAVLSIASVHADDAALLQLIEVLHDNGTINDEAYEQLRNAASSGRSAPANDRQQAAATEPDKEASPDDSESARVEFEGSKLRVESPDERFRFRLGGRVMADAAHYDEDHNALGSGTEMRRVRLSWDGFLDRDWRFKTAAEFAGGFDLKSAYIDYRGFEDSYFRFGRSKEPVSLEELTSSKYTTFMERAMLTELVPGFNIGLAGGHTGNNWGFSGGLYAGGEDGEEEQDEGFGLTGRVFYSPWRRPGLASHLGLSASYRELGDSHSIRFRARPESHVTGVRLVDTGTIGMVDDVKRIGLETAFVADSLSLQAEYLTAALARSNGMSDLRFSGWYAYASWFPTGEFRSYDAGDGEFGGISPRRPFGRGGPGAFELGARLSRLDLTDRDIVGGSEENLTLGLNWYPISNIRFMANYVKVLDLDRPGSGFNGDNPSIFQIRGQAHF